MLVLSRRLDETIQIGDDITIVVHQLRGNRVSIGIEAPRDLRIVRGELVTHSTDTDTSHEKG